MELLYMLLGGAITLLAFFMLSSVIVNKSLGIKFVDESEEQNTRAFNRAKVYFCTNGMFDFRKFCDYILCIKDDMSLSEYTEMALDLEILNQSIPDIHKEILPVTLFITQYPEYTYKDFEQMQQDIREDKYVGYTKDIVYMLITTMLYVKHKTIELRKNV